MDDDKRQDERQRDETPAKIQRAMPPGRVTVRVIWDPRSAPNDPPRSMPAYRYCHQ